MNISEYHTNYHQYFNLFRRRVLIVCFANSEGLNFSFCNYVRIPYYFRNSDNIFRFFAVAIKVSGVFCKIDSILSEF